MQSEIIEEVECADERGASVTVVKVQHFVSHTPLATRKPCHLPGSWEWMTSDGEDVNELPNGDFEIIQTDGILRRVR